ncbi:hypothetical protein [Streptomyces kanasensis]|uniref:hypothetical protein n=1 Tax=Streptomyces kanasensis TaxID=936756 RepID=UPI0036FF4E67
MSHIEDALRQGLRELAAKDGAATGAAPPTGTVIAHARRTRHRRRTAVGAACAAAVLVSGTAVSLGWGSRYSSAPPPSDSLAVVEGSDEDGSDTALRLGPAQPRTGVEYPYDLVSSCDYRFAVFAGRKWVSDGLPSAGPDPGGPTPAGRGDSPPDRLPGFMKLTSESTAVFTAGRDRTGPSLTFRSVSGGGHCPILPAPDPIRPPVLEQAPKNARERTWYPHDLYVHCGLRYALFDGRTWRTPRDRAADTGLDGSGRHTIVTGMARMSGDTLRFESPGLPPIDFVPAGPGDEPPVCS